MNRKEKGIHSIIISKTNLRDASVAVAAADVLNMAAVAAVLATVPALEGHSGSVNKNPTHDEPS